MNQYNFVSNIKHGILLSLCMLILCAFIYPMLLTGVSQVLFPKQANGSTVVYNGKVVGAKYIGQEFDKPYFLWGRPSAVGYNMYVEKDGKQYTLDGEEFGGVSSGSANMAESNPDLAKRVKDDMSKFLAANPAVKESDIPTDLMTASGSGMDPDISPKAAEIQIPRIAASSGISPDKIKALIEENTTHKLFGVFGGEAVNVLAVNVGIAKLMNLK